MRVFILLEVDLDVATVEQPEPCGLASQVLSDLTCTTEVASAGRQETRDRWTESTRRLSDASIDDEGTARRGESVSRQVRPDRAGRVDGDSASLSPYASARWALAVAGIVASPSDPKTLTGWGRCIAASPGAIRTRCAAVSISPRRSLLLGRMTRAVYWSARSGHAFHEMMDVVDRRTLRASLVASGFSTEGDLPRDCEAFIWRQTLVREASALAQLVHVLQCAPR